MIAIQMLIQKVIPGKWPALEVVTKKFNALESRLGLPAAKRYQCITGGHDSNTLIIERQWPSLAVLEATAEKIMADPEYQALVAELVGIVESEQLELYMPLP
jgi:hypothetical protein